jgi:hypothetical protein
VGLAGLAAVALAMLFWIARVLQRVCDPGQLGTP